MKRIKSINGYTIYQSLTARDEENYGCQIGNYNIYQSADIRDYGLSYSYTEYDNIDSLSTCIELCEGSNFAVACAMADEISGSTAQDMDLCLEIERRLDAGESADAIRESFITDEDDDLIYEDLDDDFSMDPIAADPVEDAPTLYLRDLYKLAPQAFVFIVTRDDELHVLTRREYTGGKEDGDKFVWRVTPASYPMYKNALEVEII
jgi:hypothetical protein